MALIPAEKQKHTATNSKREPNQPRRRRARAPARGGAVRSRRIVGRGTHCIGGPAGGLWIFFGAQKGSRKRRLGYARGVPIHCGSSIGGAACCSPRFCSLAACEPALLPAHNR